MSFEAQNWAAKQKTGSPSRKAVLMHLANRADPRGESCYPSTEEIMEVTELSLRTVRRSLKDLEESGLIVVQRRRWEDSGKQRWSTYTLMLEGPSVTVAPGIPPEPSATESPSPSVTVAPEEPPPNEPSPKELTPGLSFDAFWDLYPRRGGRRVGKKQAQKVWDRMKPPQRERATTAVVNYAAECNGYPKDAHRWLRDELYEEYLEAATEADRPPEMDGYVRL